MPQSQTAALPRQQEKEETDKSKQAQIEQTVFSRYYILTADFILNNAIARGSREKKSLLSKGLNSLTNRSEIKHWNANTRVKKLNILDVVLWNLLWISNNIRFGLWNLYWSVITNQQYPVLKLFEIAHWSHRISNALPYYKYLHGLQLLALMNTTETKSKWPTNDLIVSTYEYDSNKIEVDSEHLWIRQ